MPPVPKPKSARSATSDRKRNVVIVVVLAVVVAAALIAGGVLLTRSGDDGATTTTAPGGSTSPAVELVKGIPQQGTLLGNPKAKVVMAQYEDIQCPVCKKYTDTAQPAIVNEYVKTGKVRLDFRGMQFLGPDSDKALRIALAAGKQNTLWEVAGLFYENQGSENTGWVTDELIDEILAQVPGLDAAKVKADAKSDEVTKEIDDVKAEAQAREVGGTPWFFLTVDGGEPYRIEVALSPEAFRPALDDALSG